MTPQQAFDIMNHELSKSNTPFALSEGHFQIPIIRPTAIHIKPAIEFICIHIYSDSIHLGEF